MLYRYSAQTRVCQRPIRIDYVTIVHRGATVGDMKLRLLSESLVIAAPPEAIFDVLADPARHVDFDGSGTVKRPQGEPRRLVFGARFDMDMKVGPIKYRTANTVVEFEENRLIAWAHWGKHRWRYELESVEGGTRVTESFDWSTSLFPRGIELLGYPKRHPASISETLKRLAALVVDQTI